MLQAISAQYPQPIGPVVRFTIWKYSNLFAEYQAMTASIM